MKTLVSLVLALSIAVPLPALAAGKPATGAKRAKKPQFIACEEAVEDIGVKTEVAEIPVSKGELVPVGPNSTSLATIMTQAERQRIREEIVADIREYKFIFGESSVESLELIYKSVGKRSEDTFSFAELAKEFPILETETQYEIATQLVDKALKSSAVSSGETPRDSKLIDFARNLGIPLEQSSAAYTRLVRYRSGDGGNLTYREELIELVRASIPEFARVASTYLNAFTKQYSGDYGRAGLMYKDSLWRRIAYSALVGTAVLVPFFTGVPFDLGMISGTFLDSAWFFSLVGGGVAAGIPLGLTTARRAIMKPMFMKALENKVSSGEIDLVAQRALLANQTQQQLIESLKTQVEKFDVEARALTQSLDPADYAKGTLSDFGADMFSDRNMVVAGKIGAVDAILRGRMQIQSIRETLTNSLNLNGAGRVNDGLEASVNPLVIDELRMAVQERRKLLLSIQDDIQLIIDYLAESSKTMEAFFEFAKRPDVKELTELSTTARRNLSEQLLSIQDSRDTLNMLKTSVEMLQKLSTSEINNLLAISNSISRVMAEGAMRGQTDPRQLWGPLVTQLGNLEKEYAQSMPN